MQISGSISMTAAPIIGRLLLAGLRRALGQQFV
jgi:hypothetical protein